MNAAEYLIGFFEAGTTDEADRQGYRFPDVVQALSEVESAIDSWESMGVDVHLMRSCLERWKKSALNTFMDVDELQWDMSMFTHTKTQEKLTDGDLMGLQSVAEKLSASTVSYSEDARQKMRNMIEEAVKCVRADDSRSQRSVGRIRADRRLQAVGGVRPTVQRIASGRNKNEEASRVGKVQ